MPPLPLQLSASCINALVFDSLGARLYAGDAAGLVSLVTIACSMDGVLPASAGLAARANAGLAHTLVTHIR